MIRIGAVMNGNGKFYALIVGRYPCDCVYPGGKASADGKKAFIQQNFLSTLR